MKNKKKVFSMIYDYAKWKFSIDGEELYGIDDRTPIKISSTGIMLKSRIIGNIIRKAHEGRVFTAKFEGLVITTDIEATAMLPNIVISPDDIPNVTMNLYGKPKFDYVGDNSSQESSKSLFEKLGEFENSGHKENELKTAKGIKHATTNLNVSINFGESISIELKKKAKKAVNEAVSQVLKG